MITLDINGKVTRFCQLTDIMDAGRENEWREFRVQR
jgi:hypothetical protein